MTMAELEIARNMFDDWLYFVRKEAHDEGYELIAQAEELSYKTCERCGRRGKVRPTGWVLTLCWWDYFAGEMSNHIYGIKYRGLAGHLSARVRRSKAKPASRKRWK
jgi:hypothetical protein